RDRVRADRTLAGVAGRELDDAALDFGHLGHPDRTGTDPALQRGREGAAAGVVVGGQRPADADVARLVLVDRLPPAGPGPRCLDRRAPVEARDERREYIPGTDR